MSRKRKNFEDELEPTVKLVSDGDLLVQRLLEKQLSKQSNLQTELQRKKIFISSTDYKPLSEYVSGINSLSDLEKTSEYIKKLEEFTGAGLCEEDVHFYLDSEKGFDYLKLKHKNLDPQLIKKRLLTINDIVDKYQNSKMIEKSPNTISRLRTECMLSAKPNSVETNLLKFAINNEKPNEGVHTEMEPMKIIEKDFMNSLNDESGENMNITKLQKKVQRRLRALSSKINAMTVPSEKHAVKVSRSSIANHSKWDLKYDESESMSMEKNINNREVLDTSNDGVKFDSLSTPRNENSGNRYTIREGTIIKLDNLIDYAACKKLSMEEILNIPKFSQYNAGQPSKILYLKNTHSMSEIDLKLLFKAFNFQTKAIKVMKGRMKGQAFIEMENCQLALQALTQINGIIVKNKPIIIQFSTKSELPQEKHW